MDLLDDDTLSKFNSEYLDYLEGWRDQPPSQDNLSEDERRIADAIIACSKAGAAARAAEAEGWVSRPSIEELFARTRLAAGTDEAVVGAVDEITQRIALNSNGQTRTRPSRGMT